LKRNEQLDVEIGDLTDEIKVFSDEVLKIADKIGLEARMFLPEGVNFHIYRKGSK
jgi:hypothetical protein